MFNKVWLREYLTCIGGNVFVLVQVFLALFLVNLQFSVVVLELAHMDSIAATDKDTYLFQYAMAAAGLNDAETDYEEGCARIRSLPGIAEMGELFNISCPVAGGREGHPDGECNFMVMDSIVTSAVTYRMKEGRWLDEGDREGEVVHAVLGGAIREEYDIGDRIRIEPGLEGSFQGCEVEVVGKLADRCNVLDLNMLSAGQDMFSFMMECEDCMFVNHAGVFDGMKEDAFGTPTAHCVVKLDPDADKELLSGYGKLVSFDEMRRETEVWLHGFLVEAVEEGSLWMVVILFGIVATSYLQGKRRRYVWGVYLMLGEKPGHILRVQMIGSGIAYLVGATVSLAAYQTYVGEMEISMMVGISVYHVIVDAVLLAVMMAVNWLGSRYIMKIEPKEILTQTKE